MIRHAPLVLAALPLLAAAVAGAFASGVIAVVLLAGLWIAGQDRNTPVLAAMLGLLLAAGLASVTVKSTVAEALLFAAAVIGAVQCHRLPDLVPARALDRAATVFLAAAILLPVLVLAHGLLLHRALIPPWSLAPDLLAKPTFVAMTLVAPATVLLWRRGARLGAALFVAFMAVMALGSASSTATLAFGVAALTLLLARWRPGLGLALIAAVLLGPLVLSVGIQAAGVSDWTEIGLRLSWTYRLELWQRALILFQEAPLTGHGFDSFADAALAVDLGPLGLDMGRNHPHAAVMQLLAEGGVPAALAFALLVWLAASRPRLADATDTAARLAAVAAGLTPLAIGLNLWADISVALVLYPWLACGLFLAPAPDRPAGSGWNRTGSRRSPSTSAV
ncbi:O-antigen ligase family protein [Roseospira goensis]|uniref:O-antigen ligase n=1 Tax=Roseospira goensis TaxID=391922 RepID=A0A7W6WJB3_9PROT|nr:O-antigen ligase family protein [Roseospira goensis]MBB4284835.1 O-antigen ligase [Roseospira goensis]